MVKILSISYDTALNFSKRIFFLIILVVTIICLIYLNNQEIILEESTRTVEIFHWQKITVNYEKGTRLKLIFSVIGTNPVDILVFNKTGYNEFFYLMTQNRGLFKPITYILNTETANVNLKIPEDETIYIIVNNAGKIKGSAIPREDVTYRLKISTIY